jgi:hypothetical protein
VLAGHLPAATRRLRALTGRTWDQVVSDMRGWRGLTRPRKLELLGWVSKQLLKDEAATTADHPLRDPWLDGQP